MDKAIFLKKQVKSGLSPFTIIIFSLLLSLVIFSGCNTNKPEKDVDFLVPVSVSDVRSADVEDQIVTTGTLRAGKMIVLEVETGGFLEFAKNSTGQRLAEGDRVKKGDIIAMIIGEDVRLAAGKKAKLQGFEAQKDEYEATKKLYDEGFRSKSELLTAQSNMENARLEYERSINAEKRSRLVTPIDGVVLQMARDTKDQNQPFADGQFVKTGFEVARIAPTDPLIADVDVVGKDMAMVKDGLPVRVRQYAFEGIYFQGKVRRLAPMIDPVTRALRAEVEVDNPSGQLRPGMFVEVTIIKEKRKDVPVVPRIAVTERGGKRVVFILKGQRVAMKEVKLGLGDDDIVEIREGLVVGERIVTRGLETLTDQSRVRVTGTN
jgi:membrane fusion protein (multidrug efflux system)